MSKIAIHVWHTPDGQIIAIGRLGKASGVEVIPVGEKGHTVFATDVDEHIIKKLHETHVVDVQRGVLVPREHESISPD